MRPNTQWGTLMEIAMITPHPTASSLRPQPSTTLGASSALPTTPIEWDSFIAIHLVDIAEDIEDVPLLLDSGSGGSDPFWWVPIPTKLSSSVSGGSVIDTRDMVSASGPPVVRNLRAPERERHDDI